MVLVLRGMFVDSALVEQTVKAKRPLKTVASNIVNTK